MKKILIILIILLFPGLAFAVATFPGCEGFGCDSYGGSGRHLGEWSTTVYKITSLANSGSGTFREALEASGPRVVIFETSGTIVLTTDLYINNDYITIAGQTAPAPGIQVRGHQVSVRASNVLIQHMRFRPGDDACPDESVDALSIYGWGEVITEIVIDHNTIMWGMDGTSDWGRNDIDNANIENVTFSNNMVAYSLNEACADGTNHSFTMLMGGDKVGETPINISLIKNAIGVGRQRHPYMRSFDIYFANNYIYNYMAKGTQLANGSSIASTGPGEWDIIGNHYEAGPATDAYGYTSKCVYMYGAGTEAVVSSSQLWVDDNICPDYVDNRWDIVEDGGSVLEDIKETSVINEPDGITYPGTAYTPMAASAVKTYVLANVGAWPADRDLVENGFVAEATAGTSPPGADATTKLIDSQDDQYYGDPADYGWPDYDENTRALTLPANPNDDSGNGYTNLEVWLQAFAAEVETGVSVITISNPQPTGILVCE